MADMLDMASRAAQLLKRGGTAGGPSILAATVTAVSPDGTATVDLGQGQRTTVRVGSGVSAGDAVQVLLDGQGGASVLSNETDPPSNERARTALEEADAAHSAAIAAQESAEDASASAATAADAAAEAQDSAREAAYGLSEVEKVVETATWIAEHGRYVLSGDEAVVEGRVYYERRVDYIQTTDVEAVSGKAYYEPATDYAYEPTPDINVVEGKAYWVLDPDTGEYSQAEPVGDENPADLGWYERTEVETYAEAQVIPDPVFAPTSDTSVVEGKSYYEFDGEGYEAVIPDGSEDPSALGWYEGVPMALYERSETYDPVAHPTNEGIAGYYVLSVDESVHNYIASHLYVLDDGLYVRRDGNGYRVNVGTYGGSDGVHVIDPQGVEVASFGQSIGFDPSREHRIGTDDAYILFTPEHVEDGETVPASIYIGGPNVTLGSTALADVSDAVEGMDAAMDAAAASAVEQVQGALDDARRVATDYVSDFDADGVLVHARDGSGGVSISDTVQVVRGEDSVAEFGESFRIGKQDETHMEGTSSKLAFTRDGGDLAWFGQESADGSWGLHAQVLYIEDMQRFGQFAWVKRSNGNMTLKWLEV